MTEQSAGSSAAAKAAQLRKAARRGPWRRLLAAMGLDRRGARDAAVAGRWEAGAEGERRTAALLAELAAAGWYGLYDRALPGGGRTNADHVLIPPCASFVVNVDSKLWSKHRGPVGAHRGRLVHGDEDRHGAIGSVLYEFRRIAGALGVPVVSVIVVHSAPVASGRFTLDGVEVVRASLLVPLLRSLVGRPDPKAAAALAERAGRALLRYVEGGDR